MQKKLRNSLIYLLPKPVSVYNQSMSDISLKALSAHLGLTNGTVSRALNNYPDIALDTRKRVQAAADLLGYTPNSNARRLATGDAECVGYVLPWRSGHLAEPFLSELLEGLSTSLAKRHWDLMLSVAHSAEDELAIINRLVKTRRVNGLVISRTLSNDPRVKLLQSLNIPFITHGRTQSSKEHAWFDVDNYQAFFEAFKHLVKLGHQHIAFIGGPPEYCFAEARLDGFKAASQECSLELPPSYLEFTQLSIDGGEHAMSRLLALRNPPTAVLCISDVVAIGAMKMIREFGWTPGREVSIIGYDGLPMGEHTAPALTTMTQPSVEAGEQLGNMLLSVIDGDNAVDQQVLLRARLIRRETDAPPLEERVFPV